MENNIRGDHICFLLGSGISLPAGFPGTEEITKFMFDCEECYRHTDGTYVFSSCPSLPEVYTEPVSIIKRFLCFLKEEISQYYKSKKVVDYEDLFYMASQIADAQSKEYDNPAIQPMLDKIFSKGFLDSWEKMQSKRQGLFKEARYYITDAVRHKLWLPLPEDTTYLNLFADAARDKRVNTLDVFSLNHDLLLEQYFMKNNISIIDGFTTSNRDLRYWQVSLYEKNESKLRLYKLHGSINWCRIRNEDNPLYSQQIVIATDPDYTKDEKDNYLTLLDKRSFLIGTFNKMLEYTAKDIYLQLFCIFRQHLHAGSRLIVSGYSFGDKGINSVLINWLLSNENNSMLIIHPDISLLRRDVGGAILNKWKILVEKKVLRFIEKPFEETSWNDVVGELWRSKSLNNKGRYI